MTGVPIPPRRVFGVHLAACAPERLEAWLCRAHPGTDGIRIEGIERFENLPGGSTVPAQAAAALVLKISEAPRSAWGFDAPFVASASSDAPESQAGSWLRDHVLTPLRHQGKTCALPLDPLPRGARGMPPAMQAAIASTYLLQVSAPLLRERLVSEGLELPELGDADWGAALRRMAAADLVRPMARRLRQPLLEDDPGARTALLCALGAWRGYRLHDHAALHGGAAAQDGFVYS
jgi:hypothetical protein